MRSMRGIRNQLSAECNFSRTQRESIDKRSSYEEPRAGQTCFADSLVLLGVLANGLFYCALTSPWPIVALFARADCPSSWQD